MPVVDVTITLADGPAIACRNKTGKPDPDACSKYCGDHPFEVDCDVCGLPVLVTYGSLEVIGNYHSGCFGYPACMCRDSHRGSCP